AACYRARRCSIASTAGRQAAHSIGRSTSISATCAGSSAASRRASGPSAASAISSCSQRRTRTEERCGMRSLFIRILLWFLFASTVTTLIVTIAGQWFVQTNLLSVYYSGLLGAHLEQAREAYERDGADGLRRFTTAFERGFARGMHVTDTTGHDLLTGEDIA